MSLDRKDREGGLHQKRRLENKKRKAQAFLDLIKNDNKLLAEQIVVRNSEKKQDETNSDSSDGESPCKKIKVVEIEKETDETISNEGNITAKKIKVIDVTKRDKKPPDDTMKKEDNDVLLEMRKALRERQKAIMQRPKVFLTLDELTRDTPTDNPEEVKETPPLLMMDVQHLLMFALLGNNANNLRPRWCRLLRVGNVSKVVAVVLDSVSSEELNSYSESLPTLKQAFDIDTDIIPPVKYGSSVREDLLNVQITVNQLRMKMNKETGEEKEALKQELQSLIEQKKADKSMDKDKDEAEKSTEGLSDEPEKKDFFDRRRLMLSSSQILHESIPMPYDVQRQFRNYVFTKDEYEEVTRESPMYGIDCEMIQTTASMMDLARVSIVSESLETIYDTFVKPRARVRDYVTRFSGITKKIMDGCNTYIEDVQQHIQNILPPDAILCGQSIGGDLRSLKMFHPYVIDTSVIFNLTGRRYMKTGLKRLAKHFLGETIQDSAAGHSSVEDAATTIQLVKLKLQNGLQFGDFAWPTGEFQRPSLSSSQERNKDNATDKSISNNNKGKESTSLKEPSKVVTGQSGDGGMSQRKLFFHNSRYTEFLLKRIRDFHRTGLVFDEPKAEELYPASEYTVYLEKDKQRQKETLNCLQDKDFCLTHFYAFRDLLTSDNAEDDLEDMKKKCLLKLDKRIGKMMTKIPQNSLLVVILTGQQGNEESSAKVFCKITGSVGS